MHRKSTRPPPKPDVKLSTEPLPLEIPNFSDSTIYYRVLPTNMSNPDPNASAPAPVLANEFALAAPEMHPAVLLA